MKSFFLPIFLLADYAASTTQYFCGSWSTQMRHKVSLLLEVRSHEIGIYVTQYEPEPESVSRFYGPLRVRNTGDLITLPHDESWENFAAKVFDYREGLGPYIMRFQVHASGDLTGPHLTPGRRMVVGPSGELELSHESLVICQQLYREATEVRARKFKPCDYTGSTTIRP